MPEAPVDSDLILRVAMLAGQHMSQAGAEAYRVEETMQSILQRSGYPCDSFALMTGLTASIRDPHLGSKMQMVRIRKRSINLYIIHTVNQISRDLALGQLSIEEAEQQLLHLEPPPKPLWMRDAATLLMSGAFALLLNGVPIDALASCFNGIFLVAVTHLVRYLALRPIMSNVLAGLFTTIGARLFQNTIFTSANYDIIIAGSLMLMFPGTAITNAIRDTINGDYVSSGARAIEAFVTASALAIGAGLGLWITGGLIGW